MQYLSKRGKVYWLKRRIPADIQSLLPPNSSTWVQESLRTSSDKEARRRRDIRLTELQTQWDAMRREYTIPTQHLTKAELRDALRLRAELTSLPPGSEERDDFIVHVLSERVEDIQIQDVGSPFRKSAKSGEFYGIATGETVSLREATEAFLANTRLRPKTKNLYRTVLGQVAESLPYVDEVTKDSARAFLQAFASTRTKKAVNNLLSAVRTIWKHLGRDATVWDGHRIEAGKDTKRKGVYTSEELQKLLTAASNRDPRLYDAVRIAVYSGLRRQEVCGLEYDAELDQLVVTKQKSKNAEPRRVPCHSTIRESVRRFLQSQKDRPLREKNLTNTFSELLVDSEVTKVITVDGEAYKRDFHALRHTFASKMVELGVPTSVVGRILGHKPSVTEKYAGKADPETLRQYIDKLLY